MKPNIEKTSKLRKMKQVKKRKKKLRSWHPVSSLRGKIEGIKWKQ